MTKAKAMNRITPEDIAHFQFNGDFNTYQTIATKTAIYPGQGTYVGLMYVTMKLGEEAGEFGKQVAKALRDDPINIECLHTHRSNDLLASERRRNVIKELGDILWYVATACNELEIKFEEIAVGNLEKLADRSRRGTLQGDGDDR